MERKGDRRACLVVEIGYDLSCLFQRLNIQAREKTEENFGNGGRKRDGVAQYFFEHIFWRFWMCFPHIDYPIIRELNIKKVYIFFIIKIIK